MNDARNLLSQIQARRVPDDLVARCLDALREIEGMSYIDAVLEVARAHKASADARDIAEATKYLDASHPIKSQLQGVIENNALNLPDGAYSTITVIAGDAPPVGTDNSIDAGTHTVSLASITVGALWVKRAANLILIEREREARRPRTRRATRNNTRHGGSC